MRNVRGNGIDHATWLRRREFLKAGGFGALGLIIAASTTPGVMAQDATPSLDNIKANLSKLTYGEFNPNYVNAWPLVIATVNGYFKEVGLEEVEQVLSEEVIAGLIGGSLDMTHADTDGLISAAEASGLPIKAIAIFREQERWIMGVREGIETPEDLKGGKITGGALDGRSTWVQKQLLIKMGLDPEKDVEFVPTSGASDKFLMALLNGIVDAAALFPRHEAGLNAAGGKFLYNELTPNPQEVIGAMQPWITANEDTVYAWALAEIRARQWLFDRANKDEAYKLVRDYGFEVPPEFVAQYEEELGQISPDGGFGDPALMDDFMAQLVVTGNVPEGAEWRDHFDFKYIWAAQEELGLPRRPATL